MTRAMCSSTPGATSRAVYTGNSDITHGLDRRRQTDSGCDTYLVYVVDLWRNKREMVGLFELLL